ncbi:MAG: DUF3857 domain-containing protein [Bacteroidota bacterium]
MKTTLISTLLLCMSLCLCINLNAQDPNNFKFGKVSDAEVLQKQIDAFPEADAVYLMNTGYTHVTYAGSLKLAQERHYRIKVLTEEGQEYADIEIPYYAKNRSQSISTIKAVTYYEEDGSVVQQKVKNSEFFDEDVDGYWRQKKVAMPNVKPGAVIEIKYTILSDDFTSINNWYFQTSIPVLYSKFTKEVIEGFYYNTVSKGSVIGIDRSSKRSTKNIAGGSMDMVSETFIAKQIPPLKSEAHVNNLHSYVSHLTFQLKKVDIPGVMYENFEQNWVDLNKQWMENMASDYKSNGGVRAELAKVDLSGDEAAKIAAIYHHVQSDFTYNKRTSRYPYPASKEVLRQKKGNGSAINVLLMNLYKEAGYEAYPCLISTRDNGVVQQIFPTTRQFDHTIVALKNGEGYLLLDATQKNIPLGILPVKDLNLTGLIMKNSGHEWVSLSPTKSYSIKKNANLQIAADGSLEGMMTTVAKDYGAISSRISYFNAEDKDEYLKKQMIRGFEDAELIDYEIKDEKDIYKPFVSKCNLEINDFTASSVGDRIYLKPLLNESIDKNPFELEKRTYPVDFGYGRDMLVSFSYLLPEGFEVESIPEPVRMTTSTKDLIFQYQAQALGNMVQVQYILQIKEAFHLPNKYEEIKAFYDQVVKKHGEQIVLRRKS